MTGIYKITNKLNGKSYIGQAKDIELRWKQHKEALKSSEKSWYPEARNESNSIEDFDFIILQECKIPELDELESYWIKEYDSYNNGYNKTEDGLGIKKSDKIFYFIKEKNISKNIFIKAMSILNGNAYKLYHYLYLISQEKESYKYDSTIGRKMGMGENSTRTAIKELIEKHFIIQHNNEYLFYYTQQEN